MKASVLAFFLLAASSVVSAQELPARPGNSRYYHERDAATLVSPEVERIRITNRLTEIKKQVKKIDDQLSTGKLPPERYGPLQEFRTSLEQERQSLEHEQTLMDSRSPLIQYFAGTSPAVGVRSSTAPVKSLWEAGGWARYEGVLPCIGCDGVNTEITLYSDGLKFTMTERYLGPNAPDREFSTEGLWTTLRGNGDDPDATVFELDYDHPGHERHFLKMTDDVIKLIDLDESKLRHKPNLLLKRVAP